MAAAAASVSSLMVVESSATIVAQKKAGNVSYNVTVLNSFAGLKVQNGAVAALGVPECTELSFARNVGSLQGKGRRDGGGALSSKCSATEEIFRIAAIMNGLVLIGVAVGFVLLRIEPSVEKAERFLR